MTQVVADQRWDVRLWGALAVLCTVIFLDGLDVSMVGVALPSIQEDLGLSTSTLQWVVSGYVLGYGGFLLLGGRTADLVGRRRVLLVALGVFAAASLLGGLTDDAGTLIAARFAKGISAGFTAPAALSLITTTFPEGPARNRALSIFTAAAASGWSFGLVLSGLLTEVGWRWTFLMPVPVAVLALVVGARVLPRHSGEEASTGGYDLVGAATVTGSMLLLVFTVVEAPEVGWGSARTVGSLAAVAALLLLFVTVERRAKHPLIRLGILRSSSLARANIGLLVLFGSYLGFQFVAMQYLQNLMGWSPLRTALTFLPAGILVAVSATKMGGLATKFGTPRLIAVGSVALLAGFAVLLSGVDTRASTGVIVLGMLLVGAAFALSFPALNIQAVAGVEDHEQGLASGLLNTSGQIGGAVMTAIATAVLTSYNGETPLDNVRAAMAVSGIVAVIGLGVALSGLRRTQGEVTEVDEDEVLETV